MREMKKLSIVLLLAMLSVAVAACGGKETGNQGAQSPAASIAPESAPAGTQTAAPSDNGKATQYPFTVKDATGAEITFDKAPERIVSVSPSETEILFVLGLGDKVFGVSDFDDYPQEAAAKPKMGSVTKPNEEAIIAANADLVIGGISMKDDVAEKFRSLGMKLYKTEPKTVQDVMDNILRIGAITDTQDAAEAFVAQMQADVDKVKQAAATLIEGDKKRVYLEFSPGWTVGKGEFLDELITTAGGLNIASDLQGWKAINEEKIIQDDPEVILYAADLIDNKTGKPLEELIRSRSGWDKITAIKEGRMAALDRNVLARPGPRITQGLLAIAEGIYPGLVKP